MRLEDLLEKYVSSVEKNCREKTISIMESYIETKGGNKMSIKEKRHPDGMINLGIVPFSTIATESIKKYYKIPSNHHVLVVDMGETE